MRCLHNMWYELYYLCGGRKTVAKLMIEEDEVNGGSMRNQLT